MLTFLQDWGITALVTVLAVVIVIGVANIVHIIRQLPREGGLGAVIIAFLVVTFILAAIVHIAGANYS